MNLKGKLNPEAHAIFEAAAAKHRDYIHNPWKYEKRGVVHESEQGASSRAFWNAQIKRTYKKLLLAGADTEAQEA